MQTRPLLLSKITIMKTLRVINSLLFIGLSLAACPVALAAQSGPGAVPPAGSTNGTATKAESTQKKARPLPFQGKIKAVDKAGGTFTIGERTFLVNTKSKIMNRDKTPASPSAVVVGEQVSGSYLKQEDGRLVVNTLYIWPKETTEKPPVKPTETPKKTTSAAKP
jgi:hypothetical protein